MGAANPEVLGVQVTQEPPANVCCIFGNSIANLNTPTSVTLGNGSGFFHWMNYFLKSRFDVYGTKADPVAGYHGYSSFNTADLLGVVKGVTSLPVEFCFITGLFENDIVNGIPSATAIANAEKIINAIRGAGKRICLFTPLPDLQITTAAQANTWFDCYRWTRELPHKQAGVYVSDVSNIYIDQSATYPTPLQVPAVTAYVSAGPHPNPYGAYLIGKKAAIDFAGVGQDIQIFPAHYLSVAGGGNTIESAISNPLLNGTGGANVAPVSAGNVPNAWTAYGISATSGALAKEARTDFPQLSWNKFSLTGPAGAYAWLVSTGVNLSGVGLAVGDCVQAFAEFGDVTPSSGYFGQWRMDADCIGGSKQYNGFWIGSGDLTDILNNFGALDSTLPGGVMATRKFIIPAGTTALRLRIYAQSNGDGAGGDATYVAPFGRCALRKIN